MQKFMHNKRIGYITSKITLLQIVVTWISDDELQIWCKKSVFGTGPLNRSLTEQNTALEAAIKDIS
ncbi:hypothetical protein [Citrobacter farmeri]|uniref:hypothetical protein n=1 Tax=Citrobacter farmeri TaxID=67824 RepID=UPI00388E9E9C|nr:hypothetical protein [Citrobacter farmeri]